MPGKEKNSEVLDAITLEFPFKGKICSLQINKVVYSQEMATGELYIHQLVGTKQQVSNFRNALGNAVNNTEFVLVTGSKGDRILFQGPIWMHQPGTEAAAVGGLTLKHVILKFFKEIVTLNLKVKDNE